MSAPARCQCEGLNCQNTFIDRCDHCPLSLCRTCLDDHPCRADTDCIPTNSTSVQEDEEIKAAYWSNSSSSSSGTSSSSSSLTSSSLALSNSLDSQAAPKAIVPVVKKRKVSTAVLVREPIRNFYSADPNVIRQNSTQVSLITSKSTSSWVWSSFKKFDEKLHPNSRNTVSCNICKLASEKNENINFTVEYKVSHRQRQKSSSCTHYLTN